jgi:hypothetical protein
MSIKMTSGRSRGGHGLHSVGSLSQDLCAWFDPENLAQAYAH